MNLLPITRAATGCALLLSGMTCALAQPAAHAIRTQDGHPDLTGVWSGPFRIHASGMPLITGATPYLSVSQGDPYKWHILSVDELSAIADKSVKEHHGIPVFGRPPVPAPMLTAEGQKRFAAFDLKKSQQQEVACYPDNLLGRGSTFQIVQNPQAIAVQYEGGTPARIIFMDGRSQANAIPQWNGNSVGHWEGATLKVHTVAIRGEGFGILPMAHLLMDEQMVVDEAFSVSRDGRTLDVLTTLNDPTIYAEPLRRLAHYTLSPDVMVTDYTCTEGKEDMIEMSATPTATEADHVVTTRPNEPPPPPRGR